VEDAVGARESKTGIELAFPNAAGIDIGSASHFVAVPPDRAEEPVREFKSFTESLAALADWLEHAIKSGKPIESSNAIAAPEAMLVEVAWAASPMSNALPVPHGSCRMSSIARTWNLLGGLRLRQGFGHRTRARGEARPQPLEPTLDRVVKRRVNGRIRVV
jgi:hypothetical protein